MVYYNKIPTYSIFYLLKGDYILTASEECGFMARAKDEGRRRLQVVEIRGGGGACFSLAYCRLLINNSTPRLRALILGSLEARGLINQGSKFTCSTVGI